MSFEPGEGSEDGDPFDIDVEDAPVEDADKPFNWFGLRNTEPPVGPAEIGSQVDWDYPWYTDLVAGFIKQSGGEGLEAWHHYVIAGLKLWQEKEGLDIGGGSSDEEERSDGDAHLPAGPIEEEAHQGPLPPE